MTYSPSGAWGGFLTNLAVASLRDCSAPRGPRTEETMPTQLSLETAALKLAEAWSQDSAYLPESVSASQTSADFGARSSGFCCAGTLAARGKNSGIRNANSNKAAVFIASPCASPQAL